MVKISEEEKNKLAKCMKGRKRESMNKEEREMRGIKKRNKRGKEEDLGEPFMGLVYSEKTRKGKERRRGEREEGRRGERREEGSDERRLERGERVRRH